MITLDITDSSIKLLVTKGKSVDRAASLPLEPGLVKDGVIENQAEVAQQLRQLFSTERVGGRQVDVCLSGIHSIYRIITLPKVSSNLVNEAVRREMERLIPVPLDQVYLFWQTLVTTAIDLTVCALVIPRNTADALTATLQRAGLDLKYMTLRPLALAKLVDESNAIVVNMQPGSLDTAIIANGIPELLRTITLPSTEMPGDQRATAIAEELERTVAFYNSSHEHVDINKDVATYVSGELAPQVSAALPYRVKELPKFFSYPANFAAFDYAANLGLAAIRSESELSPVRLSMNVIPTSYLPKTRVEAIAGWGFIALGIIALAFFAFSVFQEITRTAALQAQVQTAQAQVKKVQGDEQTIKKLEAKRDELKATVARFKQPLTEARELTAKMNGDLASLTRLLPGTVTVKSIKCGQSLSVIGVATDKNIILGYVRALRDTNRFSSVLVSNMTENKVNQWDFTLTLE